MPCVIVGDLNARCGDKVCELTADLTYKPIDKTLNDNGREVIQICKDNKLLVLNNLEAEERNFPSDLTFRRKNKWISEVDICLLSSKLVKYAKSFHVSHDNYPSDHAPVSVELLFTPGVINPEQVSGSTISPMWLTQNNINMY